MDKFYEKQFLFLCLHHLFCLLYLSREHPLTKKELTDFVGEAILILEDELRDEYLTEREFDDYINLFRTAAERIFKEEKHSVFRREVDKMTRPLIELPSIREKRLLAEIEAKDAALTEKEAELARMKELLTRHNISITP